MTKRTEAKANAEMAYNILLIANCMSAVGNLMSLLNQQQYDNICSCADGCICQKEALRWGERMRMLSLRVAEGTND